MLYAGLRDAVSGQRKYLILLRVVLQNLIGNALKFQDGTKAPAIEITAEPQELGWQFTVRDNGIGIDPAYHNKIFAIFQRLHRKEDYPGTGIGLSTCKNLLSFAVEALVLPPVKAKEVLFFHFTREGNLIWNHWKYY